MTRGGRLGTLGLLALALTLRPPGVLAQPADFQLQSRATVEPSMVRLGEPATYRGRVLVPEGIGVKWLPPEPDEALTWGPLAPRRIAMTARDRSNDPVARRRPPSSVVVDTLEVTATLQAFRIGVLPIPGLRIQVETGVGAPRILRLPTVNLVVQSVLTPADSNADLRPMRGPIAAPWWERVPWRWVALGALLAAAGVVFYLIRRRRRRPVEAAPVTRSDPAAIALAELAALRGINLPGKGRFAEHAFHLTRILRRFLEAATRVPHPGDTTPELMAHLETTRLTPDELNVLESLLRGWDRVKFARAPATVEEAQRAEQAVEQLIRRHAPPPAESKVA